MPHTDRNPPMPECRTRRDRTLRELTAAHPEFLKFDNLPDNCNTLQIAVYSQRSVRYVREALRTHALDGAQAVADGSWRIKRTDAVRWIAGQAPTSIRSITSARQASRFRSFP